MSYGIYKFENNINHKIYIGQTFDLESRYDKHKKNIKDKNHTEHFYNGLRKWGWNNFSYEVIESFEGEPNRELLNELEQYWISYYDSYHNGYNMNEGGANGNYILLSKPIEQYDLEGNFIKEYKSAHAAARELGINFSQICAAARGKIKYTKYFQWRYKEDNRPVKNIKNDIIILDRPICKYDLNYNLIKEYASLKEATEENNTIHKSAICKCCQDKIHTAGNFIWRYKDNFFIGKERKITGKGKTVLQFDKNGNFIKEYKSASEASRETGISCGNISNVCLGRRKTANGYIWKYKK